MFDVCTVAMPSLFLFGRRWLVGSDDFVFPSILAASVQFIWILAFLILWPSEAKYISDCGMLLHLYFFGIVLTQTVIVFWNVILVRNSMQGTIMKPESRKLVPFILYVKVFLEGMNVIINIFGSILVFGFDLDCLPAGSTRTVLEGFIIFFWISQLLMLILLIGFISSTGNKRTTPASSYYSVWKWRCKCLCCSCFPSCSKTKSSKMDSFSNIARILSSIFEGIDLVLSDVIAGLILLNFRHKLEKQMSKIFPKENVPLPQQPQPLAWPASDCKYLENSAPITSLTVKKGERDWMNPRTAKYFLKFAIGSYGWILYTYNQLRRGKWCVPSTSTCCSILNNTRNITEDNCCWCNLAAVSATTQLAEEDIVYGSFNNKYLEIPFYVAVDHETSSVVVAIRGTLSLCDALTDMTAEATLISAPGVSEDWRAHKGMLLAAKRIQARLESSPDILLVTFTKHPSYQLIITGHSLGAGVAVLLSFLLKCRFPRVKCIAFSPPGGLLCLNAAKYSEEFCLTVIVGLDLVPRLSIQTLELLKRDLITEITICPFPKYRLLMHTGWLSFFRYFIPSTITALRECMLTQFYKMRRDSATPTESASPFESLYVPGSILHIQRQKKSSSESGAYFAYWAQREDFTFVVVSTRMLQDHLTDTLIRALHELTEHYG